MNPYTELGLSPEATIDEIKQKYKILAQRCHPDKGGDENQFKQIKLAYEILSDPVRRKQYDTTGKIYIDKNIREEAITQLSNIILNIISNFNSEHEDLIIKLKVEINGLKEIESNNIQTGKLFISNLEKVQQRVKLKKENTENLILGVIAVQFNQRLEEIQTFKRRVQICDIMLEILEDYHYSLNDWAFLISNEANKEAE